MIERRPFAELGGANHRWLDAKHHFSFAGYHDAARMGWGALRVWNDDTIAPVTTNNASAYRAPRDRQPPTLMGKECQPAPAKARYLSSR